MLLETLVVDIDVLSHHNVSSVCTYLRSCVVTSDTTLFLPAEHYIPYHLKGLLEFTKFKNLLSIRGLFCPVHVASTMGYTIRLLICK